MINIIVERSAVNCKFQISNTKLQTKNVLPQKKDLACNIIAQQAAHVE